MLSKAVLSKKVLFSKQSLGVVVTAVAVAMGLLVGGVRPSRAQDKAAAPQPAPLNWKDNQEFQMASAADMEKDPAKKLTLLNQWKQAYPATDPKILDVRNDMFLGAYKALGQARQEFDMAQEVLKTRPNDLAALGDTVEAVMAIKPAPSAADLDAGEKAAMKLLDDPAAFANKPATMSDADWAKTQTAVKGYAEQILVQIYVARKDDKRAVNDLTKLLQRDPSLAVASYQLGTAMLNIIRANKKPEDQPPAFWQYARAASYTGPNALPDAARKQILDTVTKAYTGYHGSAEGFNELLAAAKVGAFPPAGWHIKSTVEIATEQAAAEEEKRKNDPLGVMWREDVKANLLKDGGDATWENNVKDAELPPPDKEGMPQYFKAKIISMTPATNPKEITVAVDKPDVPDAKLTFEKPLDGKMEPGEEIRFKGQAKEFEKSPFMITFLIVDPKEDLNGSWTGKKAPAGRGGTKGGATKGTAPAAPAKAAPKQ